MGVFIKSFLQNIKEQSVLAKLILINICVFVIVSAIHIFSILFELSPLDLNSCIAVNSNIKIAFTHLWTFITYMFVHYEVLHILFNMLMLYWFGRIFLMYFTPKNLVALYILGGLVGAFFYIFTFNTIPYFVKQGDSYMIGASASVMAIIFASAFYNKNLEIVLLLIGRVKIVYIALFMFLIDFVSLGSSSNLGGHIAHIGGAVLGYFFAIRYLKGKDITKGLNMLFDKIANLLKPKPKMRVTFNKKEADQEYNQRKYSEAEQIDMILDKIKKSGYESLSDKEKKQLFDASNR